MTGQRKAWLVEPWEPTAEELRDVWQWVATDQMTGEPLSPEAARLAMVQVLTRAGWPEANAEAEADRQAEAAKPR